MSVSRNLVTPVNYCCLTFSPLCDPSLLRGATSGRTCSGFKETKADMPLTRHYALGGHLVSFRKRKEGNEVSAHALTCTFARERRTFLEAERVFEMTSG